MKRLLPLFGLFILTLPSFAATLTFEGFADGTSLTTQYSGVTFTNAIVVTSGISLNEFEFPPHAGVNVISDNGGPITIDFATPINNFSGYFTYLDQLTIQAFGPSNTLLTTTTSLFSSNAAISGVAGSSPNELDSLTSASGISSITITGDPLGGSFVLDDATYSNAPEPASLLLTSVALMGALVLRRQIR